MASVVRYGSVYAHADNEVRVNIAKKAITNQSGFVYAWTETWTITGVLQSDTLQGLRDQMTLLEAGYKEYNQDVVWTIGNVIVHQMVANDSMYGVQVVSPPSFPRGDAPGELVNRRSYSIVVEASFLYPNSTADGQGNPFVVDYNSSFSTTGTGGSTFGHLPTLTGYFQKQTLTEKSVVTGTQTGMRSALYRLPLPDEPLEHLAQFEKLDRRQIREGVPRRVNNIDVEYSIFWTYTFERNRAFPLPPTT